MAEQLRRQVRKAVRRRKIGAVRSRTQTESLLSDTMDECMSIMGQMEALQERLSEETVNATAYMEELQLTKFTSNRADGVYDHPPQKTTNTFDTAGLFEDVAVEDFISSVKIQKGMAEKVIDPKILSKHMTSTKSALKPKTLKLKPRK